MKQEKFNPEIYPQPIYFTLAFYPNEQLLTQCLCDPEEEKIKQLQGISNSLLSLCFGKQSMSTASFLNTLLMYKGYKSYAQPIGRHRLSPTWFWGPAAASRVCYFSVPGKLLTLYQHAKKRKENGRENLNNT